MGPRGRSEPHLRHDGQRAYRESYYRCVKCGAERQAKRFFPDVCEGDLANGGWPSNRTGLAFNDRKSVAGTVRRETRIRERTLLELMSTPASATDSGADIASTADRAAVERAKWLGEVMDDAIPVPGTDYRIGLDPILGILPVSGDAVAAVASLYIVVQGYRIGVPLSTIATMLAWVGLDFAVGSIPILGTILDAGIKANKRNAETLEAHLESQSGSGLDVDSEAQSV